MRIFLSVLLNWLVLLSLFTMKPAFGAAITADQVYRLNHFMGKTAFDVGLGTQIQNLSTGSGITPGSVGTTALAAGAVTTAKIAANAVGIGQLDPALVQYTDTNLTSAQILALFTTPVQTVPAPGAGKANVIEKVIATLTFATAYTCNAAGLISAAYTNGSGVTAGGTFSQAFCQSSAAATQVVGSVTPALVATNAPIVIYAGTANPTGGTSTLQVRTYYRVIPVPLP